MEESANHTGEMRNSLQKLFKGAKSRWKRISCGGLILAVFLFLLNDTASQFWRALIGPNVEEAAAHVREAIAPTASFDVVEVTNTLVGDSRVDMPCQDGPPPQLKPYDRAIQLKPGHIKLRSSPDIDEENIIGEIEKCHLLTVLDGPKCDNGYNFYRVHPDQSEVGWAAESSPGRRKYWLVPVLDDVECNLPPIFVPNETAISDHPSSGFIRKEPALSASTLPWVIVDGDSVKILEGPICNESYIWYKVYGRKHPEPGWAQLGEGNDYWFDIPERITPTNAEDADASC